MTPEERDIIGKFLARVGGAAVQPGIGGSVPATTQALPPIDPEADHFIRDQFATHPEAPYRVTQMAFVQEAALAEAQNRIKRLEYDLQQAQQQAQLAAQQAQAAPQSRGFLGGLFGGASAPAQPAYAAPPPQYAPPPQASYPPGYQPGMFQRGGGSGFLGSALTTAAGVAGGVLAADAISSMFSGGHGYGGGFGGGGFGGGGFGGGGFGGGEVVNETIVNNYGTDGAAAADPWGGGGAPAGGADPWGGGGTSDPFAGGGAPDAGGDSWSDGGGGGDTGGGWDSGGDSGGGGGDDSF
jgi:hypothetical protein